MPRNRRNQEYVGRHRPKVVASGQHKQDKLPPPDIPDRPPRSDLISSEPEGTWSRWYDPNVLRGIDPDIVSPVPAQEASKDKALPSWLEPKRKVRPQYIVASVATALVAVPALLMAGWIANSNAQASTTSLSNQLYPGKAYIPVTLVMDGSPRQVCITLTNSGKSWTAWASGKHC